MSIKVMSRVWDYSRAKGTPLLVILSLADFADDDGECWPSISTIARKCRLSDERHVRRIIHEDLELRLGEVVVIPEGGKASSKGGLRSNRYRITVHMPDGPLTLAERPPSGADDPGSQTPQTLAEGPPLTLAERPPESSVESPVEPSKTRGTFDDDFEAVWTAYPRKLEKAKALKAYIAWRKAGASHEDLLAATKHYAGSVVGADPKYVKLGATFYGPNRPFSDWIAGPPEGKPGGAERAVAPDWERAVNPTPSW